MPCEIAPQAIDDLQEIGDYIAKDSPARARSFIMELLARGHAIADAPRGYPAREELGADIRGCPHGRYIIYFSTTADGVRIERILHSARDVLDENILL